MIVIGECCSGGGDITWNFSKFLVENGVPEVRYSPSTPPKNMESEIRQLLSLNSEEL